MGIFFIILLSSSFAFSASTKDKAKSMFRSPSGEPVKIPEKFQPIDHSIKQATEKEQQKKESKKP